MHAARPIYIYHFFPCGFLKALYARQTLSMRPLRPARPKRRKAAGTTSFAITTANATRILAALLLLCAPLYTNANDGSNDYSGLGTAVPPYVAGEAAAGTAPALTAAVGKARVVVIAMAVARELAAAAGMAPGTWEWVWAAGCDPTPAHITHPNRRGNVAKSAEK